MPVSEASLSPIIGMLGRPRIGDPTELLIEVALAKLELDWKLVSAEVTSADLAAVVAGVRGMNWRGLLCGPPHKEAILRHLDHFSPDVDLIGAVNCVVTRPDRSLEGFNTEGAALCGAVERYRPVAGLRAVIVGAGTTARAVAVALAQRGASHLSIVSRARNRAKALTDLIHDRLGVTAAPTLWEGKIPIPPETRLIVLASHPSEESGAQEDYAPEIRNLAPGSIVCDLAIQSDPTSFMHLAGQQGYTLISGNDILIRTILAAVFHWTGRDATVGLLQASLENYWRLALGTRTG